ASNPVDYVVQAVTSLEVGEDDRLPVSYGSRVTSHHSKVGSDVRREIDLVDDEQIAAGYAGSALARHLVAAGHVDDVDTHVNQLRAERCGEVVAPGFEKDDFDIRKLRAHLVERLVIDRGVLADRGMRAAAGLNALDALDRQRAGPHQKLGILVGVDV